MKFLDSNILIYAVDETQPDKYERACDIVEAAIRGNGFVISAQVLNEFASVMYRKFKKSDEEVKELLSIAGTIKTVPVMPEWTQLRLYCAVRKRCRKVLCARTMVSSECMSRNAMRASARSLSADAPLAR